MGGRGPIPCKFGVQCHRQDCWYSHPAGRAIDAGAASGAPAQQSGRNINNGSNANTHHHYPSTTGNGINRLGPAINARPGMAPGVGGAPQASPRMGGGGGACAGGGGGGGGNVCRYAFECKRRDCHFNHPFGRAIDADGGGGAGGGSGGSGGSGGGRPLLNRPPSNNSVGSMTRGMSELSFGSYPPANSTDDDQDLRDTWFPKARDCTCCKGYVYGCTSDICESIGQCTCSIEEKDLDGSSSVSSSSISRSASPQIGMGTNGSPMGVGGEGARPPQPPSEAAVAAGAGGRRPSPGSGRGAECRYGTGCKRADCSFSHPQGRSMDADGVSFGDFGAGSGGGGGSRGKRGSGGGGGGGGGKPVVDQDLMDTWYPDCRECACCKGFKHGCKTPACANAALCACSWGDGPAAPIAAVGLKPPTGAEGGAAGKPSAAEAVGGEWAGVENATAAAAASPVPPPA